MADPEKPRRRSRPAEETEAPRAKRRAARAAEEAPAGKPIPAESLAALEERAPRQTLMLGGGLLVVGLAAVGTGWSGVGSVVALVGLVSIIYGIHAFGRLGGVDMTPGSPEVVARSSSQVQLILGVVIAAVGLAVTVAASLGLAPAGSLETAVIAFVGGGFWALRGAMARGAATKGPRSA